MAYETKVIISSFADILETSKDLDEAYKRLARIANAEGVILPERRNENKNNNPKEEQND